jgi:SAM-dependent methyltransferase
MVDDFYKNFENKYRGSRELIKDRLSVYLPYAQSIHQHYPTAQSLDLGCGRGEWLSLMSEMGYEARGIDLDESMLAVNRNLGLNVKFQDALDALLETPDNSLLMVTGFHIAEHLDFRKLQDIVKHALRVLVPGGLLILETPNTENILIGTSNFFLDPTHIKPLPYQLLSFIPENAGFYRTQVLRIQEDASLKNGKEVTLYNVLTGVSPDYAIVSQKNAPIETTSSLDALFATPSGLSLENLTNRYDESHHKNIHLLNMQLNEALGHLENEAIRVQAATTELTNVKIELNTIHQANHHHWSQLQESKAQEESLRDQLVQFQEQSNAQLQRALEVAQSSQAQMQWAIDKVTQSESALEETLNQFAKFQEQSKAQLQQAMEVAQYSQPQMKWAIEKADKFEAASEKQLGEIQDLKTLLDTTLVELQNTHQANHHHWLQLEQTRKELHDVHQANHHHWQLAEQRQNHLEMMQRSWSWRLTFPVRLAAALALRPLQTSKGLANQTLAWVLNTFQKPLTQAMGWVLARPQLTNRINRWLLRWPHLHGHLLVMARRNGVLYPAPKRHALYNQVLDDSGAASQTLAQLSPRARQIYADLKAAIDQQHKGGH